MLAIYLSMLTAPDEKVRLSVIYDQMKGPCLGIATRITRNPVLAEDALHNTFLKIISQKDWFFGLPPDRQKALLVIIVKNKSIDILRHENLRCGDSLDDAGEDALRDDTDIAADYINLESYARLKGYIRALPEIYKTVCELRFLLDMDNGQIAQTLDLQKDVVAKRIQRARAMLKNKLVTGGDNNA